MGHWGVKSFENDDAADALDRAFEIVHRDRYDALMEDRNPISFDAIHETLANPETLAAALEVLAGSVALPFEEWDEVERLAYAGVVVRHAEFGIPIPEEVRLRALDWLEREAIEWDEATVRRLRRDKEIALLRRT